MMVLFGRFGMVGMELYEIDGGCFSGIMRAYWIGDKPSLPITNGIE